jgi:MFS family permease
MAFFMNHTEQLSDLSRIQSSFLIAEFQGKPETSRSGATLPPAQMITAMKISVYEAFPAQAFVTLTGGVFLPAFALALGADHLYIGALAAIPLFANLFQLLGAYFIENFQGRKKLCIVASSIPRILWAPAIILTLLLMSNEHALIRGILLALLILVHAQLAISGVAWLSWMIEVVPDGIRGRYFGLRNSVVSVATVLTTFAGGWFLEAQQGSFAAFSFLFFIASVAGGICLILLLKQPEPQKILLPDRQNFFRFYSEPFQQPNFRRLLRFSILWQFAFYFASPFFVVYTLTELGVGYSLAATYTVIGAVFELLGMRVWGHISDRTGNKPVITITAIVFTVLPWIWLSTLKNSFTFYFGIPLLHAAGGFFWAGYNLCSTNLMFRLAPRERNSTYFGAWAACNGLAACAGSLLGGALGKWSAQHHLSLLFFSLAGLKIVFLLTGALRFSALLFLRPIKEMKGMHTRQALQLLRYPQNWLFVLKENTAAYINKLAPQHVEEDKFWPIFHREKMPVASHPFERSPRENNV